MRPFDNTDLLIDQPSRDELLAQIDELRQVNAQLSANQAMMHGILNSLPSNIAVINGTGLILVVNQAWLNFSADVTSGGIGVGTNYLDVCRRGSVDDVDAARALSGIESVLNKSSMHFSMEYPCNSPLQDYWFLMTVVPFDLNGNNGAVISHLDITDRITSENKLRESEKIYRAIEESIDYGVWTCAPDGRNTFASDSFLNLVGITQEECSNFGWGAFLHPEEAEHIIAAWKECVRSEGVWDVEQRFHGVDGKWHPLLVRGVPIRDDSGNVTAWAGINLNISRIKEVELQLRESVARHSLLFETMLHGVVYQDTTGKIIAMNPAAETILGKSCAELMGNSSESLEHHTIRENGEIFPGQEHPAMVALRTGKPVRDVVMGVFNPHLQEYRWINITAVPLFYDDVLVEVYTVFEDTTGHKLAAEKLHESERRFLFALESSKIGAWDLDLASHSIIRTLEHDIIFGYDELQPEWTSIMFLNHVIPEDRTEVENNFRRFVTDCGEWNCEFRIYRNDGEVRWVWAAGRIVFNNEGIAQRVSGVIKDITNRKQVEETLHDLNKNINMSIEQERLAISRDIHDDLGQNLTIIKLNLNWISKRIANSSPELDDRFKELELSVDKLARKIQHIASNLRPPLLDDVGLTAAIEWHVNEFSNFSELNCYTMLNEDVAPMDMTTSTMIMRIVQEGLTNIARHAKATEVTISLCKNSGNLLLEITDNGCGILPEQLLSPGSYGLIGMRERARICMGKLDVSGRPGFGTTVTLTVPLEK